MFTKKPERSDRSYGSTDVSRPAPTPSPSIGSYSTAWSGNGVSGDKMGPSVIGSDLIIMGSHGRHGLKRAILGSVTDEQAKAKYPDGWTAPKPYLRIIKQPT